MTSMKSGRIFNFRKIVLLLLIVFCVAISWMGNIDRLAEGYVDKAIVQATIAYGSARALNAAVSVAQSAQVGFSAGGEASFHPLEILDPVNDMVEDYATAMKYSISSLIIQKLLVEILANDLFKWFMLAGGVILCISLLFLNGAWNTIFFKTFAFIALVRFLFVATILIVGLIDGSFLNEQSNTHIDAVNKAAESLGVNNTSKTLSSQEEMVIAQQLLENETQQKKVQEKIEKLEDEIGSAEDSVQACRSNLDSLQKDRSLFERYNPLSDDKQVAAAKRELGKAKEILDKLSDDKEGEVERLKNLRDNQSELQKKLKGEESFISSIERKVLSIRSLLQTEKIEQGLRNSIQAMLNLIAIFLLKTLLFPIAFLYLILRSFKLVWEIDFRDFSM